MYPTTIIFHKEYKPAHNNKVMIHEIAEIKEMRKRIMLDILVIVINAKFQKIQLIR